jgi:type IV pilus assembly protein PilE
MKVLPAGARPARKARGFTLIELMITVAVVSILASVAYPSYRYAILKRNRAEGRAALIDLMQQQERMLTAQGSYATLDPGATTGLAFKNYSGQGRAGSAYFLGADACPQGGLGACVIVYAVPNFNDPEVGTLRIWSTGSKDCIGSPAPTRPDLCWR